MLTAKYDALLTLFSCICHNIDTSPISLLFFVLFKNRFCIKKTEILPKDWNSADENVYAVCYSHASKGYELKVLKVEDSLVINLMVSFKTFFSSFSTALITYTILNSNPTEKVFRANR